MSQQQANRTINIILSCPLEHVEEIENSVIGLLRDMRRASVSVLSRSSERDYGTTSVSLSFDESYILQRDPEESMKTMVTEIRAMNTNFNAFSEYFRDFR